MAGRAGRRGKDTEGHVYIFTDNLPSTSTLMRVIEPSRDMITSRFRIQYPMIVNIMQVEELSLESVLSHSFAESVRMRNLDRCNFKEVCNAYMRC